MTNDMGAAAAVSWLDEPPDAAAEAARDARGRLFGAACLLALFGVGVALIVHGNAVAGVAAVAAAAVQVPTLALPLRRRRLDRERRRRESSQDAELRRILSEVHARARWQASGMYAGSGLAAVAGALAISGERTAVVLVLSPGWSW